MCVHGTAYIACVDLFPYGCGTQIVLRIKSHVLTTVHTDERHGSICLCIMYIPGKKKKKTDAIAREKRPLIRQIALSSKRCISLILQYIGVAFCVFTKRSCVS